MLGNNYLFCVFLAFDACGLTYEKNERVANDLNEIDFFFLFSYKIGEKLLHPSLFRLFHFER